jgi:subtilisin family serine protease
MAPNAADAKTHYRHAHRRKPGEPGKFVRFYKGLDSELSDRSKDRNGSVNRTRVIVTLKPGTELKPEFMIFSRGSSLDLINGRVLELPNGLLKKLSDQPGVLTVHFDRPIKSHNYRTAVTVGARTVQDTMGYTGAGVGVAIIDSGITNWHDDLTNTTSKLFPYGNQRVAKFVDFVNGQTLPYDDNGHGSHVAGIIAGNVGILRREDRHRAQSDARVVEGAGRERPGHDQQHHLGARLGGRTPRPTTFASSTCRSVRAFPSRT